MSAAAKNRVPGDVASKTFLFGTHGLGESGLLNGWSRPEDEHVWNDGPEAVFQLTVPQAEGALEFVLEAYPFVTAKNPVQDVTLFVNGLRAKFWRLREAKVHHLAFEVAQEAFFRRREGIILNMNWVLPNSMSPQGLEMGTDARELGLCFRSLTMKG